MKKSKTNEEKTASDRKYSIKTLFKSKIFIIFVISLLIEVFVCNYRHFDPEQQRSDKREINISDIVSEHVDKLGTNSFTKSYGSPVLLLHNINEEVGSVYLDIDRPNKHEINVVIGVRDDASGNYYYYREIPVIKSVESSKYIKLNTVGVTKDISIELKNMDDNEVFTVRNITLNAIRPFRFIWIRFLIIFSILTMIYILRPYSSIYNIKYTGSLRQKEILWLIAALSVLFLLWVSVTTAGENGDKFHESMYNEAARGWVSGQLSLPDTPPPELAEMDNPYDTSMRTVGYKWDAAYYNGKYYMYFGVVPLALLHYPARLLFNSDLRCYLVVFFFALLAVIGAYLIMEGINKRWLKYNTSFVIYALSFTLLIFSSGLGYLCRSPSFYVTAQTSAMAFGMLGLGCWLLADDCGSINRKYLFAGSVFMALTVGCRPNYVLYSFVFIPLFWDTIIKKLRKIDTECFKNIYCVALPYVITAALLMLYNYLRFDSPFEFGNHYQLTIYDMHYSFDISKIPLGIWVMYFQPPFISNGFPFVSEINYRIDYQGQLYLVHTMGGIFLTNFITLFLLKMKVLKNDHKGSGMLSFAAVFTAMAVLQSIVVFSTSGLLLRYTLDFVWCFIVAALVIANIIISDNYGTPFYKIWIKIFILCFALGMLYNIFISFRGEVDSFRGDWSSLYYAIERAVSFWL